MRTKLARGLGSSATAGDAQNRAAVNGRTRRATLRSMTHSLSSNRRKNPSPQPPPCEERGSKAVPAAPDLVGQVSNLSGSGQVGNLSHRNSLQDLPAPPARAGEGVGGGVGLNP